MELNELQAQSNGYIDITIPVSETTPVWPGDPAPELNTMFSHSKGDNFQLSRLNIGLHTGTHVDAPLHFIPGGKGIEKLDIRKMMGLAQLMDFSGVTEITSELLEDRLIEGVQRVLLRTFYQYENRDLTAVKKPYRALNENAARFLVKSGVVLCGIDGMTIAIESQLETVHQILLKEEIVIVENLSLSELTEGLYEMIALPMLIPGAEAAPARVLVKKSLQQLL